MTENHVRTEVPFYCSAQYITQQNPHKILSWNKTTMDYCLKAQEKKIESRNKADSIEEFRCNLESKKHLMDFPISFVEAVPTKTPSNCQKFPKAHPQVLF